MKQSVNIKLQADWITISHRQTDPTNFTSLSTSRTNNCLAGVSKSSRDKLLIEKVNTGSHAATGRQVDCVDAYFRVAESHSGPDLPAPGLWRTAALLGGVTVVIQDVGEVEAQRSAAADSWIGDVFDFLTVAAVDVYNRRALTGACWSVTSYNYIAYRHLVTVSSRKRVINRWPIERWKRATRL